MPFPAFRDLSIRRKLLAIYVLTSGVALLLASAALLTFQVVSFRRELVRTLGAQADVIGYNAVSAILFDDAAAAEKMLAALQVDRDVLAAAIYLPDGTPFAAFVRGGGPLPGVLAEVSTPYRFAGNSVMVSRPVRLDEGSIGTVRVLGDLANLNTLILRYSGVVMVVFLVSLLGALPVIARFQRAIAGPIMALANQARRVSAERNYALRAVRTSADELGLLVDSFNDMLAQIQQRDRALEAARDAAEGASRAKDEFLAVVSHELRTPLTPILVWTRMLRDGLVDAQALPRATEIIERNAQSQAQLIEDLLDVSRIITGKLRLDVHPVDLGQVVQAAVETVRPTAEVKGVRLQAVVDPRAGLVAGDGERLKQVIWNLLSNAIKFTPRDGTVQAVLRRAHSHLEVVVQDSGPGIDPDFLPYVFDRFRQADASSTRAHHGLGLGLAIVRHLVELHGGTVRASNRPGGGATFTVELPLSPLLPEPERVAPALDAAEHPLPTGGALQGLRVLAVDDDVDTVESISTLLSQQGAQVRTASSATDALALFERWRPGLIVSDIGMPGDDGYALMRQIRARAARDGGRTPAIALTAYARVEDRVAALDAGFEMHLAKPIQPAEFLAVVRTLAGRDRGA